MEDLKERGAEAIAVLGQQYYTVTPTGYILEDDDRYAEEILIEVSDKFPIQLGGWVEATEDGDVYFWGGFLWTGADYLPAEDKHRAPNGAIYLSPGDIIVKMDYNKERGVWEEPYIDRL